MSNERDELIDLVFDLSSLGIDSIAPGKFDHLNVRTIIPEEKDIMRAKTMAKLPKGKDAGGPLQNKANPQANAIQNSEKLVRRSKAVVAVWGTGDHETVNGTSNPWRPFKNRLVMEGFRAEQIEIIANYKAPSWML